MMQPGTHDFDPHDAGCRTSITQGGDGLCLGIDMGGTTMKIGLTSGDGLVRASTAIPTPALDTPHACDAFAERLRVFAQGSLPDDGDDWPHGISCIGLAVPGVVQPGKTTMLPNVALDVAMLLHSIGHCFPRATTSVVNDADAAALGEMWRGAGMGARNLMMVMIGTGLGAGIVVDGHVLVGASGAAGEIGHLKVEFGADARPCGCGGAGCLEQYASGTAIARTYRELCDAHGDAHGGGHGGRGASPSHDLRHLDAARVFGALEQGDPCARQAVGMFTEHLGFGLAQACAVIDPDIVLLGGGVSASAHLFLDDLRAAFRRWCIPPCADTPIKAASRPQNAGIIGAALHARDRA